MNKENNNQICFTIGHSNHSSIDFVRLLQLHGIEHVIDVRSSPYSKYTTHFNKKELSKTLSKYHISYLYLGNKLGGRYKDSNLFTNGIVDYKKVRQQKYFKEGIQEIIKLIENGTVITLMCSEKNPFDCHRFVLVSYSLSRNGISVKHILKDGDTVTNKQLEDKLIQKYGQKTLFDSFTSSKDDELDNFYEKRNWDIAYSV